MKEGAVRREGSGKEVKFVRSLSLSISITLLAYDLHATALWKT